MQINPKFNVPQSVWPVESAEHYILDYAKRASDIKGVASIWAVVHGMDIDIYTAINRSMNGMTERLLHEVELQCFKSWGDDAPVDFHITYDEAALARQLRGVEPVMVAS